jgi:hypothetical protein
MTTDLGFGKREAATTQNLEPGREASLRAGSDTIELDDLHNKHNRGVYVDAIEARQ